MNLDDLPFEHTYLHDRSTILAAYAVPRLTPGSPPRVKLYVDTFGPRCNISVETARAFAVQILAAVDAAEKVAGHDE